MKVKGLGDFFVRHEGKEKTGKSEVIHLCRKKSVCIGEMFR